jgi:hypothetical protein
MIRARVVSSRDLPFMAGGKGGSKTKDSPYSSPFCPTNWSFRSANRTLKVVSEP